MSLLRLESLSADLDRRPVLRDISLTLAGGEVVGLIGPNGAGKSTLMRAAMGLIPFRGRSSLAELSPRARAEAATWLPQSREIAWPLEVETLVSLGRRALHPARLGLAPGLSARDRAAIERAMRMTDVAGFRHRPADALSGGEQARVLLARALAQEAPLLMADEPAAGLDPAHQIALMQVFRNLAREGRGVLVSLHDLGLAARWCDRLVLLQAGRIAADGPPEQVLTPDRLRDVYGIEAEILRSPSGLSVSPLSLSLPRAD